MKILNRIGLFSILLPLFLIVMMATSIVSMAAQPTVNLGTTSRFAVLAGATITNTRTTTISGSVDRATTLTTIGGRATTVTIKGGQLPKTSENLYELLLIGVVLTLIGAVGWKIRKGHE